MAKGHYREFSPPASLSRDLVCTWTAWSSLAGEPHTDLVLPDGCMDVIWTGAQLIVAGPDTAAFTLPPGPSKTFAGMRFRPGRAPAFLGLPASALRDIRVDARDLDAGPLRGRLGGLLDRLQRDPLPRAASQTLEAALIEAIPEVEPVDPLVDAAVAFLRATRRARPVATLARELGAGDRQLHRRFVARIGYGPKMFHRVVRFRRFLNRFQAASGRLLLPGLAALAAEAGYADQAHLARDCQRLTGLTPSRLRAALLTAGA